jgi:ribosomal protein S19
MSRSNWKGFIINSNYKKKNVWFKGTVVLNSMVGLFFFVYTGKIFKRILVTRKMVGYKVGEFVRTRKYGKPKANLKKSRIKK